MKSNIALVYDDGLRISTDAGESWEILGAEELPYSICSVAFHPEESILLFGGWGGRVVGLNWETGEVRRLGDQAHIFGIWNVAWSRDGRSVWASTQGGGVWVLRIAAPDEVGPFGGSSGPWEEIKGPLTPKEMHTHIVDAEHRHKRDMEMLRDLGVMSGKGVER